jgi:uncharacterized protein YbcC (UPF0753/DUF2309 family)
MILPPPVAPPAAANAALDSAIEQALTRIPPLWPLKHFVAVNPFVGLLDLPFTAACALLQRTAGAAPLQSPADYLAALDSGRISAADLAAAAGPGRDVAAMISALEQGDRELRITPIATVADVLDQERPRAHWSVFVVEEIAKYCAIAFDENQTTWNSPWKNHGLYASWRESAVHDRNPESFGLAGFRTFVAELPAAADACIARCIKILDPQHVDLADFLHRQLTTVAGWAGYVQYLAREDSLRGRSNPALRELLAIRLAYDAALFQAFARDGVFRADWRHQSAPTPDAALIETLADWQFAYEHGFQRELARALAASPSAGPADRPSAQAVFCIDVRSEVFRRHLEAALPGVQTIGFAGFFGFPVAHRPAGASELGSRCPVLLVPPVESGEPQPLAAGAAAGDRRARAGAWKAFQNSAASCFSFVETVGLAFGATLAKGSAKGPSCSRVAPALASSSVLTRAELAEGALRNMGLIGNFARLVLICGHGSQSANNPYASALDCGACGGHAGDVNARLAAATFNDPAVRQLLADRGIPIPDDTLFIAGLHQTTTDEIALFDLDRVPASHQADLRRLRAGLAEAGAAARRERAPSLGLGGVAASGVDPAVRARATDIAQVRPEWGLANNAALIAAPRARTANLKLNGRVFLHDYQPALDPEDKVLTLILCAPVVVASWINLQYYASRVDPVRYGAGNKVLHHVVGGIGVMEGNAGDLKVGLPLQSIHDGEKFVHEPRRLTVYLEAAPDRIEAVLQAQPAVKQLFDHGWIHLISLAGNHTVRYTAAGWIPI